MELDFKMDRETARLRSSTWPLHDPAQIGLEASSENGTSPVKSETPPECESPVPQVSGNKSDKKMRNAWGNMSYAEMITQAVLSSPEKRLTLSEIYEWIVRNVPYFADKASSPSTAGWKVGLYGKRNEAQCVYVCVYVCMYVCITRYPIVMRLFVGVSVK